MSGQSKDKLAYFIVLVSCIILGGTCAPSAHAQNRPIYVGATTDAHIVTMGRVLREVANVSRFHVTASGTKLVYIVDEGEKACRVTREFDKKAYKGRIEIFDLNDWTVTRTIPVNHSLEMAATSPDGKTLAYCGEPANHVAFLNLETGRETLVGHRFFSGEGVVNCRCQKGGHMIWDEADQIKIIDDVYHKNMVHFWDLGDLSTWSYQQSFKHNDIRRYPVSHPNFFVYQGRFFGSDELHYIVQSKDDSFARYLMPAEPNSFRVAAAGQLFIVHEQRRDEAGLLRIYNLETRRPTTTKFSVGLQGSEEDVQDLLDKIEDLQEGLTDVFAHVYAPHLNPLNQRVLGPDLTRNKGWVKVQAIDGTGLVVDVAAEKDTISNQDIVTEFLFDSDRLYTPPPQLMRRKWAAVGESRTKVWGELTSWSAYVENSSQSNPQ